MSHGYRNLRVNMTYIRRVGRYYPFISNRVRIKDVLSVFTQNAAWTPSGVSNECIFKADVLSVFTQNTVWTPSGVSNEYIDKSCIVQVHHEKIKTDQRETQPTTVAIGSIVNFTQGD